MKLLKLLNQHPYSNDLHFFLIAVMLLILGFKYPFFFVILLLFLAFIFRKTKIIGAIGVILLIFLFVIFGKRVISNEFKKDNYKGVITEVNNNYYILNSGLYKVKCYEYNHPYKPGDIVDVNIKLKEDLKSYEADFDSSEYLKSLDISFCGNVTKSIKTSHFYTLSSLKYEYQNFLKNELSDTSYNYVSSLVFGDNILDEDLKDSYSILGISHILAISGMHIMIFFNILSFLMLKIFHNHHKKIPLIIATFYVLLIGAPISSLRALLMLFFTTINKGRNKYTKLDILSISALIMLLFNPYSLFNIGFILSYLIAFILLFENDYNNENGKLVKAYKRYLIIFLITLPFTIKMNNKIHLLSLLLSPILTIIYSYTLIPISFILTIFPIADYIFKYLFIGINYYTNTLANYDISFNIKTLNIYLMIIYYLIFTFILITIIKKKGRIISILTFNIFMVLTIFFKYINPVSTVTFIDVGQGDSTLIRLPYNQGVMVIDCYNSFEYLKSEGISKIDYLVLTHSDSDHTGDYKKIIDYFEVSKIIYPSFDDGFNEILSSYQNKIEVNNEYNLKLNSFNFDIIGPIYPYEDANSNSIVIKVNIYDYSFLFTGDMTEAEELDLAYQYQYYLNSDVLKVAHHGSNTSSSKIFLDYVRPKYCVISVGLNNQYGHPNSDVYERLTKVSTVYMTKDSGNIDFRILNDKLNISTYR